MKNLHIAHDLTLPAEAMTLTSAVLGIRGSGKTNTAVVFTEELLDAGQQVIIIDPLDVWWGLKSSADGKHAGFPIVVLGGIHGDLPLGADDGKAIADFLVENRVPAILSLRHLRKHEQKKFVTDFAEQMFLRKGESGRNTPLLVVIDEASTFIPQSVQGDSARMVGAIEDLVRKGRASGIGVMLIDQRAASVNKDVLTQLELLIAHRHTSPQDRKALQLWVQAHDTGNQEKEFMVSLASLGRGVAWFWSPGWLDIFVKIAVRKRSTFDSSATPELGKAPPIPEQLAAVDLDKLREALVCTMEKEQATDPIALQRKIAQLQKELDAAQSTPQTVEVPVEVPILPEEMAASFAQIAQELIATAKDLHNVGEGILARLGAFMRREPADMREAGKNMPDRKENIPKTAESMTSPGKSSPGKSTPAKPALPVMDGEKLSQPQQRILDTLASFETLGIADVAKSNVAVFSDASPTSSSFGNNLGRLRTLGLLDYPSGGRVALTELGRRYAAPAQQITSQRELLDAWCEKLSGPQGRILRFLCANYPGKIERDALAEYVDASPTSSSYGNNLGALRSLGLIDYPERGFVVATKLLFPEGLR